MLFNAIYSPPSVQNLDSGAPISQAGGIAGVISDRTIRGAAVLDVHANPRRPAEKHRAAILGISSGRGVPRESTGLPGEKMQQNRRASSYTLRYRWCDGSVSCCAAAFCVSTYWCSVLPCQHHRRHTVGSSPGSACVRTAASNELRCSRRVGVGADIVVDVDKCWYRTARPRFSGGGGAALTVGVYNNQIA